MKEIFENNNVAIIGNSEAIFKSECGDFIDTFDVVCRINRGIVITDGRCQGNKTTVWAYGDHSIVHDLFSDFSVKNTLHLSDRKRYSRIKGCKERTFENYPYTSFYVNLEFLAELENKLDPAKLVKPSSGLILLSFVSIFNPSSITLFGFDWKKEKTFYNETEDIDSKHDWDLEKEYVKNNFKEIFVY